MQLDRIELKPALAVLRGLVASRGGELGREWFEALSILSSQAAELEFRVGSERDLAELKAEAHAGW